VAVGTQTVERWPSEKTRICQWPAMVTVSQAAEGGEAAEEAPDPGGPDPVEEPGGAASEEGSGVGVVEPGTSGAGGAPGAGGGAGGGYPYAG
jgi:hypothetical protein